MYKHLVMSMVEVSDSDHVDEDVLRDDQDGKLERKHLIL